MGSRFPLMIVAHFVSDKKAVRVISIRQVRLETRRDHGHEKSKFR
jgi:hypothetical protein